MTTPTPEHDPDLISARYGRVPRATSKGMRTAAILVSIISLVLFVWLGISLTKPQASSRIISFNVVDAGVTTLTFEVTKPRDLTAQCVLSALSVSAAQVGVKTITIGPTETDSVGLFEEIRTSERATTAIVDHCILID